MFNKKGIILVLIIILIVICGLGIYVNNQFQVGTAYMAAPNGYHPETNENGVVNLTNGEDSLILNEYSNSSSDVEYSVNYYKNCKEKQNLSVELKTIYINDVKVYKTIVNNGTEVYHYWFVKEGNVYEFVSFDGDKNTDSMVSNLIKSMKTSIF